ncbi:MAG: transposon-transfer assisting family protein [Mobilitalea sp.]
MSQLTFEEANLVCIYVADTKQEVLLSLSQMKEHLETEEVELGKLTESTIMKLKQMSDEEFKALELFPDF